MAARLVPKLERRSVGVTSFQATYTINVLIISSVTAILKLIARSGIAPAGAGWLSQVIEAEYACERFQIDATPYRFVSASRLLATSSPPVGSTAVLAEAEFDRFCYTKLKGGVENSRVLVGAMKDGTRWIGVKSSVLAAVRYHDPEGWLDLRFREGPTYRYLGVPVDIFNGLIGAPSKGAFFSKHIRDRYLFVVPD